MAKKKPEKKLPTGTKRAPWYLVPEHIDQKTGKKIPAAFYRLDQGGVWKADTPPQGSVVKTDTSY